MNIYKTIALLIFSFVCLAASGCVPVSSRILVSQDYVGDRSVQYLMQKTGREVGPEEEKVELFNFYTRVCNITDDGKESDCKETLILRNVQSQPVY